MKINGIIAEYNPFHNGHKYQLEQSRALTGAEYTVVVMSGNFMQRGTPALLEKHRRARMALSEGADLVLELPAIYATASAEAFASGAIALLDNLGVVTHVCFGSECGDAALLQRIASILLEEPAEYVSTLRRLLRQGMSYPNARTWALLQHYPELSSFKEVFSSPNNILGIEYIKAILRRNSSLKPVTVKRLGADYHDKDIGNSHCSALAIRQALCAGTDSSFLKKQMPEKACALLLDYLTGSPAISCDDFSPALYYKLLSEREDGYDQYFDVSSDLSDRIRNKLNEFRSFDDFCDLLKSKELTHTRISRCLLHILLNITKEDFACCSELGLTPYAHVLGFRRESTELLSAIKKNAGIPLVTKLADAEKLLGEDAAIMLRQDIQISQLYHGITAGLAKTTAANEYTIPLAIL